MAGREWGKIPSSRCHVGYLTLSRSHTHSLNSWRRNLEIGYSSF